MAFFIVVACARASTAAVTFPLESRWSATLPASPAFAPAFDDTRIYLPLQTNQLVALLIKDGSIAWSVECPMTAPPAAGAGLVFAGSEDVIEARAESDGGVQWRRPVPGSIVALHWNGGWLFAQTKPGLFFAIRASDGHIVWQKDFGSLLSQAPPATSGERLYLGLEDGRVVALSLLTGDEIWTHKFAEPAVGILPVGNRVFVGARDNHFHSLSTDDGDADWRWPTGADLLGLPVLDTRRVYFVALDNILRGHDRNNGSMVWKQVIPVRPFTGPLLSGETLIVSGVAAELHGYNAADGKSAGAPLALKGAENEEMLLAAPPHLTGQDSLILVTRGGQVRAVGSSSAAPAPSPTPPGSEGPPPTEPDAGDVPTLDAPVDSAPSPGGASGTP